MLWFPAGPCVSPFTVPTHLTVLGSASARDKDIYSLIINILFLKKPSHSYVLLKKIFLSKLCAPFRGWEKHIAKC